MSFNKFIGPPQHYLEKVRTGWIWMNQAQPTNEVAVCSLRSIQGNPHVHLEVLQVSVNVDGQDLYPDHAAV